MLTLRPSFRAGRMLLVIMGIALLLSVVHPRPAVAAADGRLELILDSSGSMKGKISGGTKIAVAKKALTRVIDKLPDDAQVGLRVYGATIGDEKDPNACSDSRLVVPIGPADKGALRSEVARYTPLGQTPISYSLEQAARDLGASGRRTVVLVSDGKESCDADPCQTAADLAKQGIDLRFDVIGLGVSGAARSQLRCIADKGHGTYADADDAEQVEKSLDQLATRAFRPFQLTGTPIEGSEDKAAPTVLGPGQYLDHLAGREQRNLYYRVNRTQPGSTIHVGATARARGNGSAIGFRLEDPDGHRCSSDVAQNDPGLVSGAVDSHQADLTNACNTADHVLVSIDPASSLLAGSAFELVVIEEPALATDRGLAPVEQPRWQPMPSTAPVAAPVPGLSLSDAPVVPSGNYSASILTGETQVFAVDLDWGQRVQVQALVAPRKGALAAELGGGDSMSIDVIGPARGQYVLLRAADQPADRQFLIDSQTSAHSATTPAIGYLNRTDFDSRAGDLAGREWVVITMNRFAHDRAFLIPYTLKVSVVGMAGDGAPQYVQPATPSPTPTPSSTPSDSPPATGSSGVPLGAVVGIAAGALVIGGAATAVVLGVRRRRGRSG